MSLVGQSMTLFLSTLPGVLVSLTVLTVLLAPPGYALLRLIRREPARLDDLPIAIGIGASVGLPVLLLENAWGIPLLLPAVAVVSLLRLRRAELTLRATRRSLVVLAVALGAAAFATWVNHSDVVRLPRGVSYRAGFDVSDRMFYALVAQELTRAQPPHLENPLFAGVPLSYSVFHPLVGLLLERYSGADLATAMLVHLPAFGLFLTASAFARLLAELGHRGLGAACLGVLLVALGGDLSPFTGGGAPTFPLARVGHFFAFHSFAAESLYYNSWMLGLPLVLVGLTLAKRWLEEGRRGDLVLAGVVLGGLWQTKVFAVLGLGAAIVVATIVLRSGRLALLGLAVGVFVVPSLALTLASGTLREDPPLIFLPLDSVRVSLEANPALRALVMPAAWGPAGGVVTVVAVTLAFLVGGFGVRLLGIAAVIRSGRGDPTRFSAFLAITLGVLTLLSLVLAGNPVRINNVQFLTLAQMLAWIPTAPLLARLLVGPGMLRRGIGLVLVVVAVAAPTSYVVRKTLPELLPENRLDLARIVVDEDTAEASRWLRAHSRPTDRLLVPPSAVVADPGGRDTFNPGGLYAFNVALGTSRRVVAAHWAGTVNPEIADARLAAAYDLLSTEDAAHAEALLDALEVRWVWEHATRPLRFHSSRLRLAFQNRLVRLYAVERAGGGASRPTEPQRPAPRP